MHFMLLIKDVVISKFKKVSKILELDKRENQRVLKLLSLKQGILNYEIGSLYKHVQIYKGNHPLA